MQFLTKNYQKNVKRTFNEFITDLNKITLARRAIQGQKKKVTNALLAEQSGVDIEIVKQIKALDPGVEIKIGNKKTIEQEALLYDTFMRRGLHTTYSKGLSNLKQRKIDILPPDILDAYAGLGEAFESYVYYTTQSI